METIAFADIEAALVAWLPGALAPHGIDQPISTRVPSPRPAKFVRIQRTGGPRQNLVVDGAQVTVEVWDNSQPAAAATARIVRAVIGGARDVQMAAGVLLYKADEFSGPFLLPDASEQHRYSWTVQLHVRGVPLQV